MVKNKTKNVSLSTMLVTILTIITIVLGGMFVAKPANAPTETVKADGIKIYVHAYDEENDKYSRNKADSVLSSYIELFNENSDNTNIYTMLQDPSGLNLNADNVYFVAMNGGTVLWVIYYDATYGDTLMVYDDEIGFDNMGSSKKPLWCYLCNDYDEEYGISYWLDSIIFDDSCGVTILWARTFNSSYDMRYIKLPSSLLTIENSALTIGYECHATIVIPNSVTSVGTSSFRGRGIDHVIFEGTHDKWDSIVNFNSSSNKTAMTDDNGNGRIECADGWYKVSTEDDGWGGWIEPEETEEPIVDPTPSPAPATGVEMNIGVAIASLALVGTMFVVANKKRKEDR